MYAKVFAQIFDSSLRDKWQAWVVFVALLALADENDDVDMTVEALAARTGLPGTIVPEGLAYLEKPDPQSRTPDEDGRRIVRLDEHRAWGWHIVNRGKYKQIRDNRERREYMRDYMRKRRSKPSSTAVNHLSTAVSPQAVGSSKQLELEEPTHLSPDGDATEKPISSRRKKTPTTNRELDRDWMETFDEVWWPDYLSLGRKCSKAAAREVWAKIPHPDGQADFDRLMDAYSEAKAEWTSKHSEVRFIPHAETWLRDYLKNLLLEE